MVTVFLGWGTTGEQERENEVTPNTIKTANLNRGHIGEGVPVRKRRCYPNLAKERERLLIIVGLHTLTRVVLQDV